MGHKMWFGTRRKMMWVRCPAINIGMGRGRWSTSGTYLNGGAYARRSLTGHKVYDFSWEMASQEEIYDIIDYADGVYGDGLIYFHEPFAMTKNVLPQFWATPSLGAKDAPPFTKNRRPDLVPTTANNYCYPIDSAQYTFTSESEFQELWIPIPPGYALYLGVHGIASETASVTALPDGEMYPDTLDMISVTSGTLTNTVYDSVDGITLSFEGEGTLILSGLVAQILPIGSPSPTGRFHSGKGHSGCSFANDDRQDIQGYSAALDKVSTSVTLIETGGWTKD